MRYTRQLIVGLSLFTTCLFGQTSETLLSKTEWMFIGNGIHKHYLFKFEDGRVKSEFYQYIWSSYKLEGEHIAIESNTFGPNSAIFQITKLNNDSLVLDPINSRAKSLSYNLNIDPFEQDSTTIEKVSTVKFYNRDLGYEAVRFDSLMFSNGTRSIKIGENGRYMIKDLEHKLSKDGKGKLDSDQLNQLSILLERSNIKYFRTADKFDLRMLPGRSVHDDVRVNLVLTGQDGRISVKTSRNNLAWTLTPLVDFLMKLIE